MSSPSKLFLSSVLCLALLSAPAGATGDLIVGKVLAEGWCASCHILSAEQMSSLRDAPSFPEIANRAQSDYAVLEGIIADPHPPMLDFIVSRSVISLPILIV